jgi:hypothetical protein
MKARTSARRQPADGRGQLRAAWRSSPGSGPAAYWIWTILATEGTSLPFRMNTM